MMVGLIPILLHQMFRKKFVSTDHDRSANYSISLEDISVAKQTRANIIPPKIFFIVFIPFNIRKQNL